MNKNFENLLGHPFPLATAKVLRDIGDERDRQNVKFPDQQIPDGTYEHMRGHANMARMVCELNAAEGCVTWRDVLSEEVAEAYAEEDLTALRKELIQVAAVAARWVEDIDRRLNWPGYDC